MKFMTFCALLSLFVLGACAQGYESGVAGGSGSLGASCTSGSDCAAPLACGHTRDHNHDTVCTTEDTARCNDGEQNGGESDIDCGFSCRSATPPNLCSVDPRTGLPQRCGNNADCDGTHGYTCVNNFCATSTTFTCGSANCTSNQTCVSNVCQNNCSSQYPTGYCAAGYTCNGTSCVVQSQYTCSATNPGGTCPTGQQCSSTGCVTPTSTCGSTTCPSGQICGATGTCVTPGQTQLGGSCTQNSQCFSGLCNMSGSTGSCAPTIISWKVPAGTVCNFYNAVSSQPVATRTSVDANTPVSSSPANAETGATCQMSTTTGCFFQTYCTNGYVPCRLGTGGVPTAGWNYCQ